ncbi:hypothetical protein [Bifidobacterium pseudolongum]|nr:hypothetical protein [Bifidobacterium pseudolongum]
MELLPLKDFVEQLNAIFPSSATVSGMKRRAEQGRLPARKSGRAWLVEVDSPEAQSFFNAAKAKAEAQGEVSKVAGLEANLQTAHEVNEQLNRRLEAMIDSNRSLRDRIAVLERQLEVAEAKLEVALQLSGVKRTPGRKKNTTEVDWAERFAQWSEGKERPTIKAFAEEVGVPRTTINAAINRSRRNG